MAAYTYEAINAQGLRQVGEIHAADENGAREQLRSRGLLAQTLRERSASGAGRSARFKKVKPKSLQVFSRQLATMIEAGVNVVSAFATLELQTDDKYLATIIGELRSDVEAGMGLSQAFARHPKVFDRLFVAMIEAGESSGTLDTVLDRIATQIEKNAQLRRRVKSALVYPIVVLTFASLVLTFMLMFIVPVFKHVFDSLNGTLPKPTLVIISMSNALRSYWFIIFPVIALMVWGFARWKKSPGGRKVWDRFRLRIPMRIGDVVHKIALARFSRTLSSLVSAGVDIVKALEITAGTAGNWVVEEAVENVRIRVQEGQPISQPIAENPVFPPMVSQMVRIGEETGELEKLLGKVADFYEDEVDTSIASLTSIIEPIMMIGVGAMVGAIVISMYLPMFKMLQLVH
jgi:type IV pilus assembly protein PilC